MYLFPEMFIKSDLGNIVSLNTEKQTTEKVTVWVKLILYYTSVNLASKRWRQNRGFYPKLIGNISQTKSHITCPYPKT